MKFWQFWFRRKPAIEQEDEILEEQYVKDKILEELKRVAPIFEKELCGGAAFDEIKYYLHSIYGPGFSLRRVTRSRFNPKVDILKIIAKTCRDDLAFGDDHLGTFIGIGKKEVWKIATTELVKMGVVTKRRRQELLTQLEQQIERNALEILERSARSESEC